MTSAFLESSWKIQLGSKGKAVSSVSGFWVIVINLGEGPNYSSNSEVRQPKLLFWPNPASAVKVFFLMDYNSSGVLWSISAGYPENILERFEKNDKIQRQSSNFKVKYIFFKNWATNKCNTSISSNFDWKKSFLILFWWFKFIFEVKRSISRSNCWKCHF